MEDLANNYKIFIGFNRTNITRTNTLTNIINHNFENCFSTSFALRSCEALPPLSALSVNNFFYNYIVL